MNTKSPSPVCFVISPIGPSESDTRRNANDFLELLVQPALEAFDFDVIRADTIKRPTVITADIIRLVQEAELCVVDLTGSNPNVFYECGRRHESGKPFIQLVSKLAEDDLPFDVAGIRTITYDLSDPRTVLESQVQLKQFVKQILDTGFKSGTSGESLTSVAQGIERIERKVSQLIELGPSSPQIAPGPASKMDFVDYATKHPQIAFREALNTGNFEVAFQVLPRIRIAAGYTEYLSSIGIIASIGDLKAFSMLESELEEALSKTGDDERPFIVTIQSMKNYFINTGDGHQGVTSLSALLERLIAAESYLNSVKGFLANQIGMLAWTIDDYDSCEKYTRIAIDYLPGEASYRYNLCICYRQVGRMDEFKDNLKQLALYSELDEDHRGLLAEQGIVLESSAASE